MNNDASNIQKRIRIKITPKIQQGQLVGIAEQVIKKIYPEIADNNMENRKNYFKIRNDIMKNTIKIAKCARYINKNIILDFQLNENQDLILNAYSIL